MKLLSILLSLFTALYLLNSLTSDDASQVSNKDMRNAVALLPINSTATKLAIESDWLIVQEKEAAKKLAKQQKQANSVNRKKAELKPKYPTLKIAGIDYRLLGIFKSDSLPFIILKANNDQAKKVIQGEEITKGVTLEYISPNKITLNNSGTTSEFKLFELTKQS